MVSKGLFQLNWLPIVAITLIVGLPLFGFLYSLKYFEIDSKVFLIGSAFGALLLSPVFFVGLKSLINDQQSNLYSHALSYQPSFDEKIQRLGSLLKHELMPFLGLNLAIIVWSCGTFGLTIPIVIHHLISEPYSVEWTVVSKNITTARHTSYWLDIEHNSEKEWSISLSCSKVIFEKISDGDKVIIPSNLSLIGLSYSCKKINILENNK